MILIETFSANLAQGCRETSDYVNMHWTKGTWYILDSLDLTLFGLTREHNTIPTPPACQWETAPLFICLCCAAALQWFDLLCDISSKSRMGQGHVLTELHQLFFLSFLFKLKSSGPTAYATASCVSLCSGLSCCAVQSHVMLRWNGFFHVVQRRTFAALCRPIPLSFRGQRAVALLQCSAPHASAIVK